MKILYLNYEFPPVGGGASPVSYEIARRYVAIGHEVRVVTMSFGDLPTYEVKEGIHIYRVKCLRTKPNICYPYEQGSYLLSAMTFLKQHLKHYSYDICHCHFLIPTGILAYWVKKNFHVPYVITIHGSDVPGYNPDRFQFLHRLTPPLLRRIIKHSEKIISPSIYLKKLLLQRVGDFEDKIVFIPNGIDPNVYLPMSKKPIIFSSGRLLARKGFQYLIQSVGKEDMGFEVHIAGDGPMMPTLVQLAKKSKTKIVLHGWLDNTSEKYKYLLGQASIFALVSAKENASISLLEAMSAACVVITSDVSGCPETVGDAGVKIAPEDPELLQQVLKNLINNPIEIEKLSNLARHRIIHDYSWTNLTKKYEELLFNT
ncbi:MAG: glycosyltransferase family 4 protein [Chitinophagales bacterium]